MFNFFNLKLTSLIVAFVLIANLFVFAVINTKTANAQFAGVVSVVSSIPQMIWKAVKMAFDKAKVAMDKAYQAFTSGIFSWEKVREVMKEVASALLYITVNIMLTRMTNNIVDWINGGMKGSPKITQDFRKDLSQALDLAAGQVVGALAGLPNGELCNPNFIKVDLRLALSPVEQPTLREKLRCSFSEIGKNLENFKKNFQEGGWRGWLRYVEPENNELGQYMITRREVEKRQAESLEGTKAQLASSLGFKPQEKCVVTQDINAEVEAGFAESAAFGSSAGGGASTFGKSSVVGMELKDIMSTYGYSSVEDFKLFWRASGGDFRCKVTTPAKAVSDLASKAISEPLNRLNNVVANALDKVGPSKESMFRPYFEAIKASLLNLMIKKERGLIEGKDFFSNPRKYRNRDTTTLRRSTNNLFGVDNLITTSNDLRGYVLSNILDFSLFAGVLGRTIQEKSILREEPLTVRELTREERIWKYGFNSGNEGGTEGVVTIWLSHQTLNGREDPRKVPITDFNTGNRIKDRVIDKMIKPVVDDGKAPSAGYPLLSASGAFLSVANYCGAFTQVYTRPSFYENVTFPPTKSTQVSKTVSSSVYIYNISAYNDGIYLAPGDTRYVITTYINDVNTGNPIYPPSVRTILDLSAISSIGTSTDFNTVVSAVQNNNVSSLSSTSTKIVGGNVVVKFKRVDKRIKMFSPIISDATLSVDNPSYVVEYYYPNGVDLIITSPEMNNANPYQTTLNNFYPELNKNFSEFLGKIRILTGYEPKNSPLTYGYPYKGDNMNTDLKTYLSGVSIQLGATPDDDPAYISVADVLNDYKKVSELYSDVFTGLASEKSLENLDKDATILTPTETNIKIALIGQRCPAVVPTTQSPVVLQKGCGTGPDYTMARKFIFIDSPNGFATNPFVSGGGNKSIVTAGLLNLDEMVSQLASLPPDANIIKILRIRQILEDIQYFSGEKTITIYKDDQTEIKVKGVKSLSGSEVVKVRLRNFPELQKFLNADTPQTIDDLVSLYGFSPVDARNAYPIISEDIDKALPDILAQITDKLKDNLLKRVEQNVIQKERDMVNRVSDFIHFAKDLNPSVQFQAPVALSGLFPTDVRETVPVGDQSTFLIRFVSNKFAKDNGITGTSTCMTLSGEIVGCDTDEYKVRGFKVVVWGKDFLNLLSSTNGGEELITLRKSLIGAIRTKIKKFYEFIGVDTGTVDFERMIMENYVLRDDYSGDGHTNPVSPNDVTCDVLYGELPGPLAGHDGSKKHIHLKTFGTKTSDGCVVKKDSAGRPYYGWDEIIEKGLEDVETLYSGLYSNSATVASLNALNRNGSNVLIYKDVLSIMNDMKSNINSMQEEISKIKEELTFGSSNVQDKKEDIKDILKLFDTMDNNYKQAYRCIDPNRIESKNYSLIGIAAGGATGAAVSLSFSLPLLFTGFVGIAIGFGIASLLNRKKEKEAINRARSTAKRCAQAAQRYNQALVNLANKFICGG